MKPTVRSSFQPVACGRMQEIAALAEHVAESRCPAGRVDPLRIAAGIGVTWSFGFYGEAFDGMLEHKSGRFHIYCCNLDRVERLDAPRSRFTLAHELGHYYIDDHRLALAAGRVPAHPSKCDYESKNPVEREADHFASNLLMPAARFTKAARKAPAGLKGVLSMAATFGTSLTSTALRYASLDVQPCAVVKWTAEGFAWKWLSETTHAAYYRATIEELNALVKDSPTARALAGQTPPAQGLFEAATTAAAWFPSVNVETNRNVIMMEQAMPLGRYGVLTFLYPQAGAYSSAQSQRGHPLRR